MANYLQPKQSATCIGYSNPYIKSSFSEKELKKDRRNTTEVQSAEKAEELEASQEASKAGLEHSQMMSYN